MKPFDIELAKQGKPVCTRDGRDVRIICFDRKEPIWANNSNIIALIHLSDREQLCYYDDTGRCTLNDADNNNCDLFMKSEKHTGYACFQPIWDGRVYRVPIAAEICETPEYARMTSKNPNDIVVKLEWED